MRYNKEQLKAVEFPSKPLLILAGAGTGKTTTIIERISYVVKKNGTDRGSVDGRIEKVKHIVKKM